MTIAILLTLTLAIPLLSLHLPVVAQLEIATNAHLSVAPTPIGVGQPLSIVMWLAQPPPVPRQQTPTIRAIPYTQFTLTITKPDNTTSVMGPYESDSTGSHATRYIPDQVGTYYFQFNYLGETITGARLAGAPITTDYYKPSSSQKIQIIVQQDPIESLPGVPLPTEYWTRPIDAQHQEWDIIAGNWLGIPLQFGTGYSSDGAFNPYTAAPNTGHIMWTIPQSFGGLVGGDLEDLSYYMGLSYQEKWNPPTVVVINGRMYYHKVAGPSSIVEGLACVDVATGEEIWFLNDTSINFGQLMDFESINVHGVNSFLWDYGSGTSTMYDAFTGRALLTVQNCRSGKVSMSPKGDLLVYVISSSRNWMVLWNSTKAIVRESDLTWSPSLTRTNEWADGIMWNVTIPSISGQSIVQLGDGVIITAAAFREATPPVRTVAGYDAVTGQHLWTINLTDYTIRPQYNFSPIVDGHFAWFRQETTQWYGFEARTGKQVWGPTEPYENSFGMYSAVFRGGGQINPQIAYGKIYTAGYDGRVHAIDLKTGETSWIYYTGSAGFETAYGHWPFYGGAAIADDKVFVGTNEHTPNSPLWRGSKLHAMNATTGEPIWNISSWMPGPIVVDGYLIGLNYYDGEIYNFGKGPSALTVEAPMTAATLGSSLVIRGTVVDISPGTKQHEQAMRFPYGVPAVADEYMSAWMEYVYMHKPRPVDAVGVEVSIDVIDANGNYRNVGTTTSDSNGFFSLNWKPDIPGKYTVIATFAGSESYWPSYAETAFVVDEAPLPSPTPEPLILPPFEMYILYAAIGIIIAIAIVGILILRKK